MPIASTNRKQKDPLGAVSADERKIVDLFLKLKSGDAVEFDTMSEELFDWEKRLIVEK